MADTIGLFNYDACVNDTTDLTASLIKLQLKDTYDLSEVPLLQEVNSFDTKGCGFDASKARSSNNNDYDSTMKLKGKLDRNVDNSVQDKRWRVIDNQNSTNRRRDNETDTKRNRFDHALDHVIWSLVNENKTNGAANWNIKKTKFKPHHAEKTYQYHN